MWRDGRVMGKQETNRGQPARVDIAIIGMNSTTTPSASTPSTSSPLFTEKEMTTFLRISQRHLSNLRLKGLPHIRLGASIRYDMNEVQAYLKTNRRLSSHVARQQRRAAIASPEA